MKTRVHYLKKNGKLFGFWISIRDAEPDRELANRDYEKLLNQNKGARANVRC